MTPGNVVERTLAILEMLSMADAAVRLSDIAAKLGIPKSATHRILAGMIERGWLIQTDSDGYAMTLQMALLSRRHLQRFDSENLRQPILDQLAQATCELVRLTTIQSQRLVWIGSSRGRRTGLVYEPDMGEQIVLHATANGKIWLATMPQDDALGLAVAGGLGKVVRPGTKMIKSAAALAAELEATRARGFAYADEEAEPGVAAVAVVVCDHTGILGTMSVAAPITRMNLARAETDIAPLLRRAAQQVAMAWPSDERASSTSLRAGVQERVSDVAI